MKSIHKRIKIKEKHIAIIVSTCICLVTAIYAFLICPQFSHADSRYISASINGESGEVDFSLNEDKAIVDFAYAKTGSSTAASKIYDAKIILDDLPITNEEKKLTISLPIGMSWVDDATGDQSLISQLDVTKGTNGVETIGVDQAPILGYNFKTSGTRVYYLTEGSKTITVNIKVSADNTINLGYIENAIVATVYVGNFSEVAKVDVNVPSGASSGGLFASANPKNYVGAGSTFSINKDYIRSARSSYVASNYYSVTRLITQIKLTFHVEGKATMQSTTTDEQFIFDDSDSLNGNYTFIYNPKSAISGSFAAPYSITFSEEAQPDERIIVTGTGETSYWQPGGNIETLAFRNTQIATYIILQNNEDVTVGWSTLDPSNSGSAHDVTVSSPIREGEGMTGMLGYGYVNNRGNAASAPKNVRITFDTNVLGVMMFRLPCSPSGTIGTIHIKTTGGVEKDVELNKTCSAYGLSAAISYADLGTEKNDYISEIEYYLGIIPASSQLRNSTSSDGSRGIVFMGARLDESQPGIATIEVFDASNPANTTGVATITSNVTDGAAGMELSSSATQVKTAGETLTFSFNVAPYGSEGPGYSYGTKTPIIYLRSEAVDAAGEFLPITGIKITNGPSRGNQDITDLFSLTTLDTDSAKLYILDGRSVTNGLASISTNMVSNEGKLSSARLTIAFSIETDITTPNQSHNISNLIFVQDPDDSSITTSSNATGDPFGISIVPNGGMIRKATTNYYQIHQSASVLTENSGKHTSSDTWLTWSEGANPITIGSVSGSAADMKVSIINNSGVEIPNPVTVYSPIPKKDQDWGLLSYDNQPFQFSTTLDGAISNPDNEHFVIAYGKNVTPSSNGNALDGEAAKFTTDISSWTDRDWQEVNCLKITGSNIPANQPGAVDTYDFVYRLKITDQDSSDGSINTWRPLFFQELINSSSDVFAGWYRGSYVSVQLASGTIHGEVFVDSNENGKKDTDEESLREEGWEINLYDQTSGRLVRSATTNANGQYGFVELVTNSDNYYMIVTNKHPLNASEHAYLFTKKGDASTAGSYNTDNQAEGDKTSTPPHLTASINHVMPTSTLGEAVYNIGVVEYEEKINYSGTISFEDQNNLFWTRPDNITINATGSDNSTHSITIDTAGDGSFSTELPKYTTSGERITYSFSSPDLAAYDKSEQFTGTTYSLSYQQKTSTLTVHHYKKGTTDRLLPDEVSTVYWGQSYSTLVGAVNTDYELDSVLGTVSGTIDGDVNVTYYYKKKIGTVTVHYYQINTTNPISEDVVQQYEYGQTYVTEPLAEIPSTFANLELVSERPDNYTGIVRAPSIEVIYYYQKKDPNVSSTVSINGPEFIDNKISSLDYAIDYSADINDYIGHARITLKLRLPRPIVENESMIDGGIIDASENTISWVVEKMHNSYIDNRISIEKEIALVFDSASANDVLLTTIEASIELEDKSNYAMDTAQTIVRTPALITFVFINQDDIEIKEQEQKQGFVGDEYIYDAPEIDGYNLVNDEGSSFLFTEEKRTVVFRYEKFSLTVPNTSGSVEPKPGAGDVSFAPSALITYMSSSSMIALVILWIVRSKKNHKV